MFIGVVGKPNVGKSTLFSALTGKSVAIANYPFTTIDPNKAVAFFQTVCACKKLGVTCAPRTGKCVDGTRFVPINLVDVAGLVRGAHEGKGMGNKFLSDLSQADCLILVTDSSGSTNEGGNLVSMGSFSPVEDAKMLEEEIDAWLFDVIKRNFNKSGWKSFEELAKSLSGLKISADLLSHAFSQLDFPLSKLYDADLKRLAAFLRKKTKPFVIAANKSDLPTSKAGFEKLREAYPANSVIACSGDYELALRKSEEKQWIKFAGNSFEITDAAAGPARSALEKIKKFVDENNGTGVQKLLDESVKLLDLIVVFPVEDEGKYSDNFNHVLPDAVLLEKNSTPIQLAEKIHSDLAKGYLYAVDARKKTKLSKDYKLQSGDVIKIVSSK